eukprot:scaffold31939_cov61-Phaeocystis_antarctica.AAC.5
MRGGIGGGSGEGGGGLGRCTQARAGSYRLVQAVLTEAEVSTSCGVRGVAEDVDAATGGIFTPPCRSDLFWAHPGRRHRRPSRKDTSHVHDKVLELDRQDAHSGDRQMGRRYTCDARGHRSSNGAHGLGW